MNPFLTAIKFCDPLKLALLGKKEEIESEFYINYHSRR